MSNRPTRSEFQTRMDEMVRNIKEQIVEGRIKPGDYLPSESELGERYRISRNSVRRALGPIVSDGWIEKVPKVGNRVTIPPKPESNKTIVHLGCYSSMDRQCMFSSLLEAFHSEHPDIQVNTVYLRYVRYGQGQSVRAERDRY